MNGLQQFLATLMNRVRVNRIYPSEHAGAPVYIKKRRFGGSVIIWAGNRFLTLADSGMQMFGSAKQWVNWEIYCSELLYPQRSVRPGQLESSVIIPRIAGVSLRQWLQRGEYNSAAFDAAARELRRVHLLPCLHYHAFWSHGDLHLDNILFDPQSGQAELIDFDTRHELNRPVIWRQADDLRTILLEILGFPDDRWRLAATSLIENYDDHVVLNELRRQLIIPRGVALILWYTKTQGASHNQVMPRINYLQSLLQRLTTTAPN